MPDTFSQFCGHFFEDCFTSGVLTFLRQQEESKKLTHHVHTLYKQDLTQLCFQPMAAYAISQAKTIGSSPQLRLVAEQLLLHFGLKGFLLGLHFLEEYLESTGEPYKSLPVHVRYIQCSFRDKNSMGRIRPDREKDEQALRQCLAQLDPDIDSTHFNLERYQRKGRFLKADCLFLLEWGGEHATPSVATPQRPKTDKRGGFLLRSPVQTRPHKDLPRRSFRILSIDLSIHSLSSGYLRDPNNISNIRQMLLSELSYLQARGVFSNLSYDIEQGVPESLYAQGLEQYLTAFKKQDKESAKLIQAGGYAYDFFTVLSNAGIIHAEDSIECYAFGVSDRSMNSIHVRRDQMAILQTCWEIYKLDQPEVAIDRARDEVIDAILSTAKKSFPESKIHQEFFASLHSIDSRGDECVWLPPLTEIIPVLSSQDPLPVDQIEPSILHHLGGQTQASQLTVQAAHTQLTCQALDSYDPYLFLLSNPGIGKTTTTVKWLIERAKSGEGFLFLYLSPRKQVNIELIDKFREYEDGPMSGSILAITASSPVLEGRTHPTVLYTSKHMKGAHTFHGVGTSVTFLELGSPEAQQRRSQPSLASLQDNQIWDRGNQTPGVLYSVCQAIAANLQSGLSTTIVATASIQSLKKKSDTNDTLTHLDTIFASACIQETGRILPEKMKALAEKMPHIIIMIDEITGDESGVAFLAGIHSFAERYGLLAKNSPFHTKILVADASVVDQRVIERHLRTNTYEPEKIYVQHVDQSVTMTPLAQERFLFKEQHAVSINTNTYPARNLHLAYHVCVESQVYKDQMTQLPQSVLRKSLQTRVFHDLLNLIAQPKEKIPQILVYIQDKGRLSHLIELLRDRLGHFERDKDYLEIHASISEKARKTIEKKRKKVRIVFMTASASRGLSFPEATHFLIDVPRFSIEANTMEILQVIYRGRGGNRDLDDKYLHFYVSDRILYHETADRSRVLRELSCGILNMLIILKTSMMTRIIGAGQIGRHFYQMIPIGSKAVSSAGTTYPDSIAALIKGLSNEARQRPERKDLQKIGEYLQHLFGEGNFHFDSAASQQKDQVQKSGLSYLPQRTTLIHHFRDLISQNFATLVQQWPVLEKAYLTGGLLVVPNNNKKLGQQYLFSLKKQVQTEQGEEILQLLHYLEQDDLPDHIYSGLNKAKELLSELQQRTTDERMLQFIQSSQYFDQYYAIPLLAFLVPNIFAEYFEQTFDHENPQPFRDIVNKLVNSWYPADSMLPIGSDYRSYPFVLFRSFNLNEVRHRIFSGNSVFASYDLNILNMLLSSQ